MRPAAEVAPGAQGQKREVLASQASTVAGSQLPSAEEAQALLDELATLAPEAKKQRLAQAMRGPVPMD